MMGVGQNSWGFRLMEMDKTQLQWLLAGIGAVIVALIYLWGIRARIKEGIRKHRRQPSLDSEPVLGGGDSPQAPDPLLNLHDFRDLGRITPDHHLADKVLVDVEIRPINHKVEPAPAADAKAELAAPAPLRETRREPEVPPPPKMTVVLTVMPPRGQSFKGDQIQAAAGELGFQLGAGGLFDRFPDQEAAIGGPVFSMAHLREPGTFDPGALDDLATPGLLLFMKLPGPIEEMKALELLVVVADQLARKLGGAIHDQRRNRMTNQALMHLRNEVAELERRRRVWAQVP